MCYYDIEIVASEGIIEEDLLASLEEAGSHHNIEHVEYSLVSEVTPGFGLALLRNRRLQKSA